jgi:hypothetical protein
LVKFAWDKQVDFDETQAIMEAEIARARGGAPIDAGARARLASYSVLLTQELNGSRVSEAYDAVLGWGRDGAREQKVVVRKHRKRCLCNHSYRKHELLGTDRMKCSAENCQCLIYAPDPKDVELRLMVIPPAVVQEDKDFVAAALQRKTTLEAVEEFSRRNMAFNTHSLRYAYISKHFDKPAQLIAKTTHHKKLEYIIDYTQQKVADDELRKEVAGDDSKG